MLIYRGHVRIVLGLYRVYIGFEGFRKWDVTPIMENQKKNEIGNWGCAGVVHRDHGFPTIRVFF